MKKGLDERTDEGVLQWFGHGECSCSCSVGRPWKRWIDTMKEHLKKSGLDIRQARCMIGVCEGECMGCSPGDKPLTLTGCCNCELP